MGATATPPVPLCTFFLTFFPHLTTILRPTRKGSVSSSPSKASAASSRFMKHTNPVFRFLARSSAVRGHMIFTEYRSPTVRNTSDRSSSVVVGSRLPTNRFVVVGSPSSIDPGASPGSYGDGSGFSGFRARLASSSRSNASISARRRAAGSAKTALLTREPRNAPFESPSLTSELPSELPSSTPKPVGGGRLRFIVFFGGTVRLVARLALPFFFLAEARAASIEKASTSSSEDDASTAA
mmetsp:Transcript_26391/g.60797  ORF Transcript_26391/g.60797 Transcript_26391/m.60797 type:complete len:239 (-) Transcript_26391:169-885(-)